MTAVPDYPPDRLSYNTLTLPSAPIPYCFPPNCPTCPFPYDRYEKWYTDMQEKEYKLGLSRYLKSRQIQYDNYPPYFFPPVFTSNNAPLVDNYLRYESK